MRTSFASLALLALLACPGESNTPDAGSAADAGDSARECNDRCVANGYAHGTLVSDVCLCENDVIDAGPQDAGQRQDTGPAPDAGPQDAGSPGESQIAHACGLVCELGFLDFSGEEPVDCPTDRAAFFGSDDVRRCTLDCLARYRNDPPAKVDLLLSCLQGSSCGQRDRCAPDQFETTWPRVICPTLCTADALCTPTYWSEGDCSTACDSEMLREGMEVAMGTEACFIHYSGPCFGEDDPQTCLCEGQAKCTGRTRAEAVDVSDRYCAAAEFCNMVQANPFGCQGYIIPTLLSHRDMETVVTCINAKLPAVHADSDCELENFLEVEDCLR
jgi:hypothetical protein